MPLKQTLLIVQTLSRRTSTHPSTPHHRRQPQGGPADARRCRSSDTSAAPQDEQSDEGGLGGTETARQHGCGSSQAATCKSFAAEQ